jgi:hypothetical protein
MGAPLHKNAIGDTAKHSQDPDTIITLDAAAVIIVGNVQTLVQATFDTPALAVEQRPEFGWQK